MRVEHLNCAIMRSPFVGPLPAHALLIHTDEGLVLVDTGYGTADYADPKRRLGPVRALLRPEKDERHTALRQLEAAGYAAADVTHVVLTHLDLDHAGGLSDFPHATVHTTAAEHHAALVAPDFQDKNRYRQQQFEHQPVFSLHDGPGDAWQHGLTGHEVVPGVTLVPMPGHSKGHAAVAVEADGRGLLLHAGDALFDGTSAAIPGVDKKPLLRAFEQVVGDDRAKVKQNHATLTRLSGEGVTVIPAHDQQVWESVAPFTLGS